jgi:multidrug efflux system outer membrane protein
MRSTECGALVALALLTGCSMAPDYRPPQTAVPANFKEAGGQQVAGWTAAAPGDDTARGDWWAIFDDPVLADLEQRADRASPTLAAALARYDQARAVAQRARADLFPQIGVGADAARTRVSGNRPLANGTPQTYNDASVGAALDYELDLWGRVRNGVKAGQADAQASAADVASARLSLQASVADAYFRLRGLDAEAALLRQTVDAYSRAYDLTAKRHDGGIASGLDVNRAKTVLSGARALISDIARERAVTEHELAALAGALASDFSIAPLSALAEAPAPPVGAPSELLQRRPDIAAAERRMFAANARIGVAKAAFFPSLTLGLQGGFEATRGSLFSTQSSFWGLGPLSAALAIFDGGRRAAGVRLSRAEYDELAASYRGTVLAAFREVEDALAAGRDLSRQSIDQSDAAAAAGRTRDLALIRYRDGASDYLEVVVAQTAALDAERAALILQTQRMRASVALVRALGGGWQEQVNQ